MSEKHKALQKHTISNFDGISVSSNLTTTLCRMFWKKKQKKARLKSFVICLCIFFECESQKFTSAGDTGHKAFHMQFWDFSISLFPKILCLKSFRNSWGNSYIMFEVYSVRFQVLFYLWWMERVLKLNKIPSYYTKGHVKMFLLLVTFLKMIQLFNVMLFSLRSWQLIKKVATNESCNFFANFLRASIKKLFLQGRLDTRLSPCSFEIFSSISLFPKILNLILLFS